MPHDNAKTPSEIDPATTLALQSRLPHKNGMGAPLVSLDSVLWPEGKNPAYAPRSADQKLACLIEECGEVLAAAGKALRWGLESVNPELPTDQQETNRDWLLREMADLELALKNVRSWLQQP